MDETLGGIQIPITADFSDLGPEMDAAISTAKAKAEGIAAAITEALADIKTDGVSSALMKLGEDASVGADGVQKLIDRMDQLAGAGVSAPEALTQALQEMGAAAQATVTQLEAAGNAAKAAGDAAAQAADGQKKLSDGAQALVEAQKQADNELQQAKGILQEMQAAYQQGAISAEALARAEQDAASAFQAANPSLEQSKQAAKDASESFGAMNSAIGLIGVSLSVGGFVSLVKDVLEVTDSLTRANIALTNITGSAEEAAGMLEKIDQLGLSDGLSIPGLQQAAISMANLLPAGTDVVGTLSLIANGAELMGTSIDAASKKFDLISESGKASDKTLSSLGLNMDKLKAAMEETGANLGEFGDDAKKAFANLDVHDRIVVLQTALKDLGDTAKQVADETFSGAWHKAVAQFDVDIALIIKDLGSVSDKAGGFGDSLKSTVNVISSTFVGVYTIVKGAVDGIIDLLTAAFQASVAAQLALDSVVSGQFSKGWQQLKDGMSTASALVKQSWADVTSDVAAGTKTITDLMSQGTAAVKVHVDALDGLGKHAKDAADKVADAMKAVQAFDAQVSSGTGGIDALQHAFENASKSIDLVAKNNLPAAIKAVDDYTAAQLRNGASGEVIMQSFQKESQLIGQLAKIDLPAASDAWTKLIGELSQGGAPLGIIQKALEDEEKVLQQLSKTDLAAAEAGWDRLIQKLKDTNAPVQVLNQALQDHTKFLDAVSKSADAAVGSQIKLAEQFSKIALNLPSANQAITNMDAVLKSLGPDADLVVQKADPLNQAMIAFGINAGKAKTEVENLSTPIQTLTGYLDQLLTKAQASGNWAPVLQALDDFDKRISLLAKTDLPEAVKEFQAWIDEMQKHNAPAELVQGQLDKLAPIIEKMAKEGLPGATAAWSKYLDMLKNVPSAIQNIQASQEQQLAKDKEILAAMQARGDAYGYILTQQEKVLQEDITIAEHSGADANEQVLALEGVRVKWEELILSSHGYADAEVKGIKDLISGFDSLAGAMSGAIVDGKNLGEALVGAFKKIGQSLLTDVIQAGMVPLKQAMLEVISQMLPNLDLGLKVTQASAKALTDAMATQASVIDGVVNADIAATAAKTANTGATAADTGATIADTGATIADTGATIADTAATIADAGATIADTAATIADTVTTIAQTAAEIAETAATIAATVAQIAFASVVTAVAGVVGAIAGIIGDVYLAAIDTKLFHVETSLLEIRNTVENSEKEAWDQFGQMYGRLGEVMNDTHAMNDSLKQLVAAGVAGGFPPAAMTALNDLDAMAKVVYAGWPTMQGALQTIAQDIVTWGGHIESDTSVMVQKLGQILTLMMTGQGAMDAIAANTGQIAADSSQTSGNTGATADNTSATADSTSATADSTGQIAASMGDLATSNDLASATSDITQAVNGMASLTEQAIISDTSQTMGALSRIGNIEGSIVGQGVDIINNGRNNNGKLDAIISASQSQYGAALSLKGQLEALSNEYAAYEKLIQQTIEKGDLKQADIYQTAANNVLAQMRQVEGDITGAASLISQDIVAETGTLGFKVTGAGTTVATAATGAGNQVTAAVNAAAVAISSAVSVGMRPTGPGSTTSTTAPPPYVGPSPTAGGTPAPTGGGGFGGGQNKTETNSPSNIPTTIVAGQQNIYDPTIPDPTKGKAPYVAPLDTASPTSSYYKPPATSGVPSLNPQPVGTTGTPLPTTGTVTTTTAPSDPVAMATEKIKADMVKIADLMLQLAAASDAQKPLIQAQIDAAKKIQDSDQQALLLAKEQVAITAQLALDQTALMNLLKDIGNAPDDSTRSALQKTANDLLLKISDEQAKLATIQQTMSTSAPATGGTEPKPTGASGASGSSTSSTGTAAITVTPPVGGTLVYTDPSRPLAVVISDGSAAVPITTTEPLPTTGGTEPAPAAPDPVALAMEKLQTDKASLAAMMEKLAAASDAQKPLFQAQVDALNKLITTDMENLMVAKQQAATGGKPPASEGLPTLKGGPVKGPNLGSDVVDDIIKHPGIAQLLAVGTGIADNIIKHPGIAQLLAVGMGSGTTPPATGGTEPAPPHTGGAEPKPTTVPTGGTEPNPNAPTTGSTGISTASGQQVDPQTAGFYAGALAELEDIRVQAHRIADVDTSFRDGLVAIGKQLLLMTTKPGESATASFDEGGPVPFDMVAKVHQGEEVLPRDVASTLRSMMRTPSYGQMKSPNYEGASGGYRAINITAPMTIISRGDPRQQAEQFVTHLKKMVPDAGAFSS